MKRFHWIRFVGTLVAIILAVILFLPLINVVLAALVMNNTFGSNLFDVRLSDIGLTNFVKLATDTEFIFWLRNSFLVSISTAFLGTLTASMAGYVLARMNLKINRFFMILFLLSQMLPATVILLPLYIILAQLKLSDSMFALLLVYSGSGLPFAIWQMKNFFETLPREVEEAALLDGLKPWQAFFKVVLPLSSPGLAVTALFNFMVAWNEYPVASVLIQDPSLWTLPLGIKSFHSSLSTQWGLFAAASLLVAVPVVLIFGVLSRYLISGLTMGADR